MRIGFVAFVGVLLGGCGSHPPSLDGARSEFLAALADYQACESATSGEIANNCEPKRLIAENAERAYRDAMSSGVSARP
jgi:hypothetical protein